MTAPSNANTSGLEVVATVVSAHGDPEAFGERTIDVVANLSRIPYNTDLVTAASAQARIAELEALVASYRKTADLEARDGDAAEARADRLANALEDIASLQMSRRQSEGQYAKDIARAALQQETQP